MRKTSKARGTRAAITRSSRDVRHERAAHSATSFELSSLRSRLKPFKLHWFPTLGSTNTHAAKLRREGKLLAPSVVLTGRQTAGRGRGSNVWHSTRGIITATFVLPAHDSLPTQHVPLVAGLAVRNAVAQFGVDDVRIKWPNDIWIHDLKLAGLLCERIGNVDLIGVGLNVNAAIDSLPGKLPALAVSMASLTTATLSITQVLIAIARELRALLGDARTSLAGVLSQIRSCDALEGRRVRVTDADRVMEGTCVGIDSAGRLLIRSGSKQIALFTGSVSLANRPKA